MEPILKESGKLKGVEVLYFENVDLEKYKGNSTSFAASGPLSILWFKDFSRFILHLNDWRYPLLRRIPISSEKGDAGSRIYNFPALNGFSYRLKFNNINNSAALSNFDTILMNNSNFSLKGEPSLSRMFEPSPDDKLVRHITKKETGPTEYVTQTFKSGVQKIKHAASSLTHSSKYLTSTKHKLNLNELKNKNFKQEAKPTFKKNFFDNEEKLLKRFNELRRENPNLRELREFNELRKTSENSAPTLFLWREEVEESILNQKDLAKQRNYELNPDQIEKKGLVENIKHGLQGFKESVSGILHPSHTQQSTQQREADKGREPKVGLKEKEPTAMVEGMTHYQG